MTDMINGVPVNAYETPNHFRRSTDKSGDWAQFGTIHSLTPICIPGEGHHPHIRIRFRGGVTVDLDTATAAELARRLPAALAFMPEVSNCSGAVADLEGA